MSANQRTESIEKFSLSKENPASDTELQLSSHGSDAGSSTATARAPGPAPPPNGGRKAWLAATGGFLFVLNSLGMANSFGVFQEYYTSTLLPSSTPSAISWIGSIQAFLLLFVGVLAGRLVDAGYYNILAIAGILLEVFGMMMTSLSTKYYQVFLAQGVCVGIGSGIMFTAGVSIVGSCFSTRRSLAMGFVASGSSVGGIIYPIAVRQIIAHTGFPWATRAMGFIMLGSLVIGFALLRPRLPPRKAGAIIDIESFKNPAYASFVIGLSLAFMAYFIPIFYIEPTALRTGASENFSFYMLAIMNAGGVVGRITLNLFADRVGNLNIIIPIAYISGIILLVWLTVHSTSGLIVIAIFYGFFSGGLTNSAPAVVGLLSPELDKIGTRIGMMLTACSIGTLIGAPVAGAILKVQSSKILPGETGQSIEDFSGVFIFAGVTLIVAATLMLYTRIGKKGLFFLGKI